MFKKWFLFHVDTFCYNFRGNIPVNKMSTVSRPTILLKLHDSGNHQHYSYYIDTRGSQTELHERCSRCMKWWWKVNISPLCVLCLLLLPKMDRRRRLVRVLSSCLPRGIQTLQDGGSVVRQCGTRMRRGLTSHGY